MMAKNWEMRKPIPMEKRSSRTLVKPIDPRTNMNIQAGKCVIKIRTESEFFSWIEWMVRLQHYSIEEILKGYATGWVFRGMESHKWHIVSSFHRHHDKSNVNGIKAIEKLAYEKFLKKRPNGGSTMLDKVSSIQHYGGYTRLVDFSMSYAVALYFAVRNSSRHEGSVWAVDCKCVRREQRVAAIEGSKWPGFKRAKLVVQKDNPKLTLTRNRKILNSIIESCQDNDPQCDNGRVLWISPCRRNERITAQAGLFLAPTLLSKSFEEQLDGPWDHMYSKHKPIAMPTLPEEMEKLTKEYRVFRFDFAKRVYGVARAFLATANVNGYTLRLQAEEESK